MNIYKLDDKQYDVSKLDVEAQSIFHFLIHAKKRADEHREELFILTEAYTSLATKLNERCDDAALVKEEQEIDNIVRDVPTFVEE
tara:strand:+ start:192 stop:446 length:255 start_codon:yes stop_codon:yes gene_type:complete